MGAVSSADFIELVPDRLYAFGGTIPLDGRASWAPESATGYQPSNSYLLRGDVDILIDTGIGYTRDRTMAGLRQVLPAGAPVSVFLTRALPDCVGGLAKVVETYRVQEIFTGGAPNPFDQFEATPATRMGVHRSPEDPPLEIFAPALRLLPSYWGYDADTKTVFTSDAFTHVTLDDPGEAPVLSASSADRTTVADASAHIMAGFWWLAMADGRALIGDQIRTFFDSHPVEIIAPGRGCILMGEGVVRRHVGLVIDAISGKSEAGEVVVAG